MSISANRFPEGRQLHQDKQYMSIATPLGKDKLVLVGIDGEDGISTLFHYRLRLQSLDKDIPFKDLVGKQATVTIEMDHGKAKRAIDGIITSIQLSHFDDREPLVFYEAELRPWLYLLTLSGDCRIFQDKSVPEIVAEVCGKAGFTQVQRKLTGIHEPRQFCVQYGETDYNFVARLLEQEGIFYYFDHTDGEAGGPRHDLVLGDDPGAFKLCPHVDRLRYHPQKAVDDNDNALNGIRYVNSVTTRGIGVDSYNFQAPATPLHSSAEGQKGIGTLNFFSGNFTTSGDGERYARILQEAAAAPASMIQGFGQTRSLCAGHRFSVTDHPRHDVNSIYVVHRLRIEATRQNYRASFDALPLSVPFRPSGTAVRPRIHSSQTAVVVGKPGEEVWVDVYGRIKVQFHWDRQGRKDENSSCWIRVAQNWAGKSYGTMFLPRVGQEVIVSFLDGDPDRPIVTGAVYNGEQPVPYDLPANATRSTIKTRSTKSIDRFNEIRFEDRTNQEELYLRAQKDMKAEILNDLSTTVGGNETHSVKQSADGGNAGGGRRSVAVEGLETHTNHDNFQHSVEKDRQVTVKGQELHQNQGVFEHRVTKDYVLQVDGNLSIKVAGTVSINGQSLSLQSTGPSRIEAGEALVAKSATVLDVSAGQAMSVSAGAALTMSAEEMTIRSTTALGLKAMDLNAQAENVSVKGVAATEISGSGMLALRGSIVNIG